MRISAITAMLCIVLYSATSLHAQSGSLSSPIFTSIGLGSGWQPDYAFGIGITSTVQMSLIDLLRKERETNGFRIRDVWGGHVGLGLLTQPDSPMVAGVNVPQRNAAIWYDVGFEWAGLQIMYVFSDVARIAIKGQMTFTFNSSGYYEAPFPTAYSSGTVCASAQFRQVGIEMGKGWDFGSNGPNYFTFGSSYQFREKAASYHMFGFRFTSHTEHQPGRIIDGVYEPEPIAKNYLFSIFFAKAL